MSQAPAEKPSIALPVVALVSVLFCWPVGLVLSIIAFVKTKAWPGTDARTLAIIALAANFVLVIPMMGIMAAIAIPNFVKFQCRSKQSEAKGNLKALYIAEESHRAETDGYTKDQALMQFAPKGKVLRYTYTVVDATPTSFVAEAVGTGDMTGDHWRITEANALTTISDVCR